MTETAALTRFQRAVLQTIVFASLLICSSFFVSAYYEQKTSEKIADLNNAQFSLGQTQTETLSRAYDVLKENAELKTRLSSLEGTVHDINGQVNEIAHLMLQMSNNITGEETGPAGPLPGSETADPKPPADAALATTPPTPEAEQASDKPVAKDPASLSDSDPSFKSASGMGTAAGSTPIVAKADSTRTPAGPGGITTPASRPGETTPPSSSATTPKAVHSETTPGKAMPGETATLSGP